MLTKAGRAAAVAASREEISFAPCMCFCIDIMSIDSDYDNDHDLLCPPLAVVVLVVIDILITQRVSGARPFRSGSRKSRP